VTAAGSAYLGIDLGTSGLKLTLVDEEGSVVAEAESSYDVHAPQSGHAETAPSEWEAALCRAGQVLSQRLHTLDAGISLRAVGVTGQMHGVVLVDAAAEPVRPAILWPDQRAVSCLETWTGLEVDARSRLGNPIVAGMAGPMLSWLHEFEPASMAATALVRSPKDWVRSLLTGDRVTERTDASATLLWDTVADDWSPEALKLSAVRPEQLPVIVGSDQVVGHTSLLADAGPLHWAGAEGVPVVAGGADIACALTALKRAQSGVRWRDALVVNVGTGIQILRPDVVRPSPRPAVPHLAVPHLAVPHLAVPHLYGDTDGGWYEMVAIQNGGFALSWVRQLLGLTWDDFVAAAASAPPGSAGAAFVPFLTGERGLVASPGSMAGWSGLTPSVGRAELARSAFEGFAFTVRRGMEAFHDHQGPVILCGGGVREPWVRQLLADVLGRTTTYVPLRSASAVGAAVLAARGVGTHLPVVADVVDVEPSGLAMPEEAYTRWRTAVQRNDPGR
jgi:xylulokinase